MALTLNADWQNDTRILGDMLKMLDATYQKILRVNLTTGEHLDIKVQSAETKQDKGYNQNIGAWLADFATTDMVHPDDISQYLEMTDVAAMRRHFKTSDENIVVQYRRRMADGFKWATMVVIKATDYAENAEMVFLFVRNVEGEFSRDAHVNQVLIRCIENIHRSIQTDTDEIHMLLKSIAEFYAADRAFVYELEDQVRFVNTHEWRMTGISPRMREIQHQDSGVAGEWLASLRERGGIRCTTAECLAHGQSGLYAEFKNAGIESFMAIALNSGAEFIGFVGVDNPRNNTDSFLLLKTIGALIVNSIIAKREEELLNRQRQISEALQKALMAAEVANTAKSHFLANISHDIRTPLNAVLGFTALAEKRIDDTAQVREYIRKISTAGEQVLSLINDVLDMSSIESGKVQLENAPADLRNLLAAMVNIISADAYKKNITVQLNIDGVRNGLVLCDALRMRRILQNVISNSIKYTPQGGHVRITAWEEAACTAENGRYADYVFVVDDDGIGMDEEFLTRLFEPFERERSTTISGIRGTGLGMPIVKNFVDLMKGEIRVESQKNVGTKITIKIPLQMLADAVPVGQSAAPTPPQTQTVAQAPGSVRKVLLVDDNLLNREIATEFLQDSGIAADQAEDGQQALDILSQKGPDFYDLVLMDIQMPVMNGYDAARAIRALGGGFAHLPIIAMTANAFESDKKQAFAVGMKGFVTKPIEVDKLLQTIHEVMKPVERGALA